MVKTPLSPFLVYTICLISLISCQTKLNSNQDQKLADLGHFLFFDTRLSYNQTKSCASCHDPGFAFTDGYRRSITASGDIADHNSPSLINISNQFFLDWANPYIHSVLDQSHRPFMNTTPIELGFKGHENEILSRLRTDSHYTTGFQAIFPEPEPLNLLNIRKALAAYVSSIHSENSSYDKFLQGDSNAISNSAKRGMRLFYSESLKCAQCHRGTDFTIATTTKNPDSVYFNTGLYFTSLGGYPENDRGIASLTGLTNNNGMFKVPSLRNVALTAPYTHDGTVSSISEMIDIYSRGGRIIQTGPHAGDGKKNPNKSHLITGFKISSTEKSELIDFLFSLTDTSIPNNPLFKDPAAKSHK